MSTKFKVIVKTGKAENNQVLEIEQGTKALRIKAIAGAKYQLQEIDNGTSFAPDVIKIKRVGKNLHILLESNNDTNVIIEDYYEVMPRGYNGIVGQAENGNYYEYRTQDSSENGMIWRMTEGSEAVAQALGGTQVNGAGTAIGAVAAAFNPLLGALGLVGAGAVAAAARDEGSNAANGNNAAAALSAISAAAQNNNATDANVSASVFGTAGVTGVNASNVAAIQSALNSAALNGAATDTVAEVQAIVDAYNAILAAANDTTNTAGNGTPDANPARNPTAAQYAAIGVSLGSATTDSSTDAETLTLLNAILGGKQTADVDTVAEVQALANIANAIQLQAAGVTPSPALTVADLTAIGLDTTGVTAANLLTLLAAIAAKNDNGSETDTLEELQALIANLDKVVPVAVNDTSSANEKTVTQTGNVEINDTSLDGTETFTLVGTNVGTNGTLVLGTDGAYVYTYGTAIHAITADVTDTFTYRVSDAAGNTSTANLTVTVTAVNDAPVVDLTTAVSTPAVAQSTVAPVNGTASGVLVSTLLGDVTDPDTGALKGMAIGNINGSGTLYYSIDNGVNWLSRSGSSLPDVVHLDGSSLVMYASNIAGNLTNAFRYWAWDQTNIATTPVGTISAKPTTNVGGSTAYSLASDLIGVNVVAPVTINNVSTDNIVAMNEAVTLTGTANAGATVNLTVGGTSRTVEADSSGNWSYSPKLVPVVRYVMVRKDLDGSFPDLYSATGIFTIADIKVNSGATNLANGLAVNTGTGNTMGGSVTNLTDGGTGSGSFYETSVSGEPWVQLDLGGYYRVDNVQISSRDGWQSRTNGANIFMSANNLSGKSTAQLNADVISGLASKTTITNIAGGLNGFTATAANTADYDNLGAITASELVSGVSSSASRTVTWRSLDSLTINSAVDDTIGATPLAVGSGSSTSDTTPTLQGTLLAPLVGNEEVAIWWGNAYRGKASVSNTTWSWTPPSGLSVGTYEIEALVTQGNKGPATQGSAPFTLTIGTNSVTVVPVVMDLNRDGFMSYGQVTMDVNGDRILDNTQWAGAQDGVLVWDKLGDGVVHDNSQYAFGQYATKMSVDAQGFARVASDLEGLADAFDTNRDGVFSMTDEKFDEFKVWQDANQNGVSDAGEVRSLTDVGITRINLVSDGVQRTPAAGVTEAGQTTANLADGSTMLVADAAFDYTALDYAVTGNTVNLLSSNMTLDLSSIVAMHNHMTAMDMSGTGANTLKLNLADVLNLPTSNGVHQLTLTGDTNDTVDLDIENWANTGTTVTANGDRYAVYNATTDITAQLWIDQHMAITQVM